MCVLIILAHYLFNVQPPRKLRRRFACFVASLGYVKGRMDTVRGRIEAEWTYRDGGFEYTVTLPKGVSASFDGQPLKAGKNIFFIKET